MIHATQYREGKFNKWLEKYKRHDIAEYLMEKEAAEKLLINAKPWKIPNDEVKQIEERLEYFAEQLNKLL